ncbi:UDP-N-acetylmuramoyl-L-alanyl-D-glutamate--2,6-diaminopimelate ligase [Vaginisenegalia massiliensis]|uniref:UDP-N-acetylmuramoyl-L-alanyl-D-glutamate--2, 6-diaminopimelate ligase n=1 Tax=Vaginisenegalia massiliensis TaxID=2058294 RepID=UPI000F541E99|nr:UDP-N-acetylmuramoyl-L-alanyl-D-glutamate--2,6-diaminopimelate ligase [Vaginisenegalia massiliensis]
MEAQALIRVLYDAQVLGVPLTNQEIEHLTNDSRQIKENTCFIAIRGEQFDGHSAVEQVAKQGAKLVIVEEVQPAWLELPITIVKVRSTFRAQAILANQYYQQPSEKLAVVAVTGTNGKTTISNMISDILEKLGHKTGLIGTLRYKVDDHSYLPVNTTPDALRLQELFNEMVEVGCQDAIIEASSHALALGRLWYTDVDCAIFTNLAREHLNFHQTMENYAYAKSLLFAQLGQAFKQGRPRLAITNLDCPYGLQMVQASSADVVTYSLEDESATAYANHIETDKSGLTFDLHYQEKAYRVQLAIVGRYNVSNYLAAFLCLTAYYGFSPEQVVDATQAFKGVTGRMQTIDKGQNFEVILDYAHTPDAVEMVASDLAKRKKNRLIIMTAHSGGNRDSAVRPQIGDIIFNYGDSIVLTSDNPRHEPIEKICREIQGNHTEKPCVIIPNREEAIDYTLNLAEKDDIILLAGKAGESYQIIGSQKFPYDEVKTVNEVLDKILGHKK